MSSLAHYKNVKQLNNIIDSYEKKLDDKVNEMFNYMLNIPKNINDITLPFIENKKVSSNGTIAKQFMTSNRKYRTSSIGSKSFIINNDMSVSQEFTQADYLLKTFKDKQGKKTVDNINNQNQSLGIGTRSIGSQGYVKPKIIRKKPQILPKQMRWDPFYEKNAVKAQELNQGVLSLVQRGKVGKNVDIITAFEKGRPILQTHQAIFHHIQQKFTNSELLQSQIDQNKVTIKKQVNSRVNNNTNPQINRQQRLNVSTSNDDHMMSYHQHANNSWALTMPEENIRMYDSKQSKSGMNFVQQRMQLFSLYFVHFKLVKDENFNKMKKQSDFYEQWGQILQIIKQIQIFLKMYSVQIVYFNGNKILEIVKKRQCLSKFKISDAKKCLISIKQQNNKKNDMFSFKNMISSDQKRNFAAQIISSVFASNLVRQKFVKILKRRKYERKLLQWIKNGSIIKQYRRQLKKSQENILKKFEQLQRNFKANFASIQQKKHYQIHIVNRHYMNKFNYFQQFCNTQITRIFNLENINTNIIYVSPFQLNVDTINYYFKIMELEQIQNYNERVTFLQLQDVSTQINLPQSLNTSKKLYFSSKALRKLLRKIQGVPSYFVISCPSEIDIKLAAFTGIPIYSGDFSKINPLRSALNQQRLLCQGIQATPSMKIRPKQFNVFQFSNSLIRYCQSNKKYRKYVLKINDYHSSAGLALLTYPFCSLPQLYSNTVLVQPYYFKSIQKYFIQFITCGGIVQIYEQGIKNITVCAKIMPDQQHIITGTFEKVSSGFVNIGYIFPQKCISHKIIVQKSRQVLNKLASLGHIGHVQLTLFVNHEQKIYLEQIQLYSTRITCSLYYFKFLAGGYLNHLGQFMTKITGEGEQVEDQSIASMESRCYCYIPFMLHFGLTDKQAGSFFQLCRIGGISFDLQNKYGTTFIILGSLKNTVGIISTANNRKTMLKLISKSIQFLVKQNSHNVSTEMLRQKQERIKDRLNVNSIKDRIQQI